MSRGIRWLGSAGLALVLTCCSSSNAPLSNAYARMDLPAGEPLCISSGGEANRCFVSFISLVANPEKYAGKRVQVIGFVKLEFEGNALYFSRDAAEVNDSQSAIWLDVAGLAISQPQTFDHQVVIVAGKFNAENRGHLGMFAGTLEAISRFDRWHK